MKNVHEGHRQRVKKEFLQRGFEYFPDHKKLEFMLFYCIPRKDTNELAHRLMDRFGSLSGVLDAPIDMLQEVEGISANAALYLKMIVASSKAYLDDYTNQHNLIQTIQQTKDYMKHKFLGETVECMYMAGLGNNGRVLYCNRIQEGSPESVSVYPVDIVKLALRVNAVQVILAHNHPSGICNPSRDDRNTTQQIKEALTNMGIELLDHVVVAADGICSMREIGMLQFL